MKTYNTKYFIAKFEAIPEEQWCTDDYEIEGKHCVMGHCGVTRSFEVNREADALRDLMVTQGLIPSSINDGRHPRYQQPTPKQRILAALRDMENAS